MNDLTNDKFKEIKQLQNNIKLDEYTLKRGKKHVLGKCLLTIVSLKRYNWGKFVNKGYW